MGIRQSCGLLRWTESGALNSDGIRWVEEHEQEDMYQSRNQMKSVPASGDSDLKIEGRSAGTSGPKANDRDAGKVETTTRERKLLNQIIKHKRDCLQRPSCDTAGSMVKNEGQTPTDCSWKCKEKEFRNQVIEQQIV